MTYLQSFLGLPVLDSALLAIPGAIVLILFSVFTPLLVEHVGARMALIVCHFSMALGMLMLAFTGTGTVFYIASTAVSGIGFGISFSLVADTAVGAVPESRAGAAGAIAETSNEIGNALGIALLGSVLTVVFRIIYPGPETGLGEVIDNSGIDSGAFVQAREAFLAGFHIVATVAAAICGVLGFLTIRWIPAPRAPRDHRS
ncbi:MFS transporter [Arachnia propionica]|uniref:MFS transporter n=1 Tax=Arachnia propionica TaxID=1750 RepID=UPI0028E49295|nr:MFS transporter [Arachnia propionica]